MRSLLRSQNKSSFFALGPPHPPSFTQYSRPDLPALMRASRLATLRK